MQRKLLRTYQDAVEEWEIREDERKELARKKKEEEDKQKELEKQQREERERKQKKAEEEQKERDRQAAAEKEKESGADVEMEDADGSKAAGKKRAREEPMMIEDSEEEEAESSDEERRRKKIRASTLKVLHKDMRTGDTYKAPCLRCKREGIPCKRAKGPRAQSCETCIEGKKKCEWPWESEEAAEQPKPRPRQRRPEAGASGAAAGGSSQVPVAGPSREGAEYFSPWAFVEKIGAEGNVMGLMLEFFKDQRKMRVIQHNQQVMSDDMMRSLRSIARSLERLANKFAPEVVVVEKETEG